MTPYFQYLGVSKGAQLSQKASQDGTVWGIFHAGHISLPSKQGNENCINTVALYHQAPPR